MSLEGLNRLKVWVKAKEFAVSIYKKVLSLLPSEEKWNLNQQLRRAALSVPANIAEGYGRFYYQDNVRFCYNARGSLDEVLSHLTIAYEMNYITEGLYRELVNDGNEVDRMLNGYVAYLKNSKQGASEPGANHHPHEELPGKATESGEDLSKPENPVL
jgi:four helix bundle protein